MPYREQIDKSRIPAHVAIIMDGNGRWAKQRGQARSFGHQAGAETVHIIAEEAARLGVKYLTLYTFSTAQQHCLPFPPVFLPTRFHTSDR